MTVTTGPRHKEIDVKTNTLDLLRETCEYTQEEMEQLFCDYKRLAILVGGMSDALTKLEVPSNVRELACYCVVTAFGLGLETVKK